MIDSTSRVGEMLARTKADAGSDRDIYAQAEIFTFCSALVSRRMMERHPENIQFCPYAIFVYELADGPGQIVVGHRDYAADGLPEMQQLLDSIVRDALMPD